MKSGFIFQLGDNGDKNSLLIGTKARCLVFSKHYFIFYDLFLPFCTYLKIYAKRGGIIKKIKCVFLPYNKLFFYQASKMLGISMKNVFMFRIKGGDEKGRGTNITKLLWIGLKWRFSPIVYNSNNSCIISKTHIISFLISTLFQHLLGDTLSISFKMCIKGRGHKKKCLRASRTIINCCWSSNPPGLPPFYICLIFES